MKIAYLSRLSRRGDLERFRGERFLGDRFRGDRFRGDRFRGERFLGDRFLELRRCRDADLRLFDRSGRSLIRSGDSLRDESLLLR